MRRSAVLLATVASSSCGLPVGEAALHVAIDARRHALFVQPWQDAASCRAPGSDGFPAPGQCEEWSDAEAPCLDEDEGAIFRQAPCLASVRLFVGDREIESAQTPPIGALNFHGDDPEAPPFDLERDDLRLEFVGCGGADAVVIPAGTTKAPRVVDVQVDAGGTTVTLDEPVGALLQTRPNLAGRTCREAEAAVVTLRPEWSQQPFDSNVLAWFMTTERRDDFDLGVLHVHRRRGGGITGAIRPAEVSPGRLEVPLQGASVGATFSSTPYAVPARVTEASIDASADLPGTTLRVVLTVDPTELTPDRIGDVPPIEQLRYEAGPQEDRWEILSRGARYEAFAPHVDVVPFELGRAEGAQLAAASGIVTFRPLDGGADPYVVNVTFGGALETALLLP